MQCDTDLEMNGTLEFNYTLVLQGRESKYPRHIGPQYAKACHRNFQVNVTDLRKDSEYRAYIVVYNGSTSLKSNQLYFCKCMHELLIINVGRIASISFTHYLLIVPS